MHRIVDKFNGSVSYYFEEKATVAILTCLQPGHMIWIVFRSIGQNYVFLFVNTIAGHLSKTRHELHPQKAQKYIAISITKEDPPIPSSEIHSH